MIFKFFGKNSITNLMNIVNKKRESIHNISPLLKKISTVLYSSVMQNFVEQGTDKEKWKPLSPVTIVMRRKGKGSGSPKILQDTGFLRRSIFPSSTQTEAMVSTNVPYAVIHQFGLEKGKLGKNVIVKVREHIRKVKGKTVKVSAHKRVMRNIPWGDIPARLFMVLREKHKEIIKNLFKQAVK